MGLNSAFKGLISIILAYPGFHSSERYKAALSRKYLTDGQAERDRQEHNVLSTNL